VAIKKDNPETKKNKTKTQHNNHYTATTTHNVTRHTPSYKQLEVKTNRTSVLCRNRNRHHNTELAT